MYVCIYIGKYTKHKGTNLHASYGFPRHFIENIVIFTMYVPSRKSLHTLWNK